MAILNSFALLLVSGTLITIVFLGVLFIFFKVMLGMLVRLGLLAVLVAFSPLAFAFYASDATAHWTKKWVSMFLGATFQQVVVLVVIYIGIGIMGDFLKSGAEYGLQAMVVGMLLAFLTLALADAVPGIVNPGGKGLFGAYGQMIGMAAAGAMVVASGGASAIAGGIAAAGAGAGAAAAPAAAAPASPGVGISTTPGAAPAAPSGGGLVSSVSRGPVGPSVPGSVAPGSVAPGSVRVPLLRVPSGRRRSGIRARCAFNRSTAWLSVWCSARCPAVRLPARCCGIWRSGIWRSGIRASTVRSAGWSPSCRSPSCRRPQPLLPGLGDSSDGSVLGWALVSSGGPALGPG